MKIEAQAQLDRNSDRTTGAAAFGFTLLELLIATAVFALVLIAVNTVFNTALTLRRATTEAVDGIIPITHAVAVMKRDLRSIVPPSAGGTGVFLGQFVGGQQSALEGLDVRDLQPVAVYLDFFSSGGVPDDSSMYTDPQKAGNTEPLPWADIQRIDYYLRQPIFSKNKGSELVRTVRRNLLAPVETPEIAVEESILDGVQELNFGYFDGTNWLSDWNSTNAIVPLPRAIMVTIEFDSSMAQNKAYRAPLRFVVPVPTMALTNTLGATNAAAAAAAAGGGA